MNNTQVSFRKFVNEIGDPKIKKEMNSVGIIGYILAAINLLISIVSMNLNGIVDVVLIAGFSLGIHIGKSRICAILLLIYGAINFIVMTAQYGRPAGYWGLILGICAIREFYKAHKQYKEYISNKII